MKPKKKLPARFAAETRFELTPGFTAPRRGKPEVELDRLKERLLSELLEQTAEAQLHAGLRRAANEAATLAWLTPFPLLFLPVLLAEGAERAKHHAVRQQAILRRTRGRLVRAA